MFMYCLGPSGKQYHVFTIYHIPAEPAPHHDQQHQQQVGRDPEHRQAHQDRRLGLGVVPAKIFVNT